MAKASGWIEIPGFCMFGLSFAIASVIYCVCFGEVVCVLSSERTRPRTTCVQYQP